MLHTIPIGGILFAWCTLMAVAPIRRPRRLATLASLSSCAPNELPYFFTYIVTASAVIAPVAAGDLASSGDWMGLALALLTVAGLGVVARRAWRARPVLGEAMRAALGSSWRDEIDPDLRPRLRRRQPWLRIFFMPWPIRPPGVEKHADIAYGDHGRANRLDVYRHRSHPPAAPTLIHLHGGHFRWGKKSREARPLLHHLASQGWTCISANYRLSATPGHGFPEHLVDVKRVIAWARAHAHEHGIDPKVIFLSGSSAGAHLTAMAALTPNEAWFQPGFETSDTSIVGAVAFYGYYGALGGDEQPAPTTPLAYEACGAPPFLVVHGDNDTYTPVEGARALVEHLRATSKNPVVLAELPAAQHSFDLFHSVRYEAVVDAVEVFAAWVRSTPGDRRAARWAADEPSEVKPDAESSAARRGSPRRIMSAGVIGPTLVAIPVTSALASCGDDDEGLQAPTTTAPTTGTSRATSTTTTDGSTTTPPPADVAAAVAHAWADGDVEAVESNAEPSVADLLLHLEPGAGPWSTGDCEGAADSTWHLEPDAVVLSEGKTTRVTDTAGQSTDVAVYQPARTGEGGIWAVVAVTAP